MKAVAKLPARKISVILADDHPVVRDGLAAILGTFLCGNRREEELFDELYIRQNTGFGASGAVDH